MVGFGTGSLTIPEGSNSTIEVEINNGSDADIVVLVATNDGTAHAGANYQPFSQEFTIPANSTSVTVPIQTLNDSRYSSPDLAFGLTLSVVSGDATAGAGAATVSIAEADTTPIVNWETESVTIPEGSSRLVEVQLSGRATYDINVSVTTANGSAQAGRDYTRIDDQFTIPAGSTSVSVPVATLNDGQYSSPDLAFTASMSIASGPAVAGNSILAVGVGETGEEPHISLSTGSLTIPEGNFDSIDVQLSGPTTSDVIVDVVTRDGTAHAGTGYTAISSQYTIRAGTASVPVTINTRNDNKYSSPDLQFALNVTVAGGTATGSGDAEITIGEASSRPTVGWQSGSAGILEGSTGSPLIVLSGPATSDVIINVTTSDGSASAGANYNAITEESYTIRAGDTSVPVTLTTLNDSLYGDQNGTFSATLSLASGPANLGTSTLTVEIGEISPKPVVDWQSATATIPESGTGDLVVQLSGPARSDVVVSVTTGNNTACSGTNYVAITAGQYTIPAGFVTVPVSITTLDDDMYSSPDLTFTAGLSLVSGPATPGTTVMNVGIGEASSKPDVGFAAGSAAIAEGTTGTIDVQLTGMATSPVTVSVATSDGTAKAGINYNVISRQYTIPAGETRVPVNVSTLNDSKYSDPDLQFTLSLSYVSGPASAGTTTSVVSIGESSPRPAVSWSNATLLIPEGESGTMVAQLSGITTSDVNVTVETSDGSAAFGVGYVKIAREFTIPAGSTTVPVPVDTLDDDKYSNPDLTFSLGLSVASGPASGSATSTVSIGEADPMPTVSWQSATALVPESTTGSIIVQLTGPATSDVVVHAATSDSTASAGTHYTTVIDDFTIPAGATSVPVQVTALNDNKYSDPNLTFKITLSNVRGPASAGTPLITTVSVGETSPRPAASWQNASTEVPEGTITPVNVQLSGPATSDVVLKVITGDNTAHVGIDYNAIGQRYTIPAGQTSVAIPITTLNDNMYSDPNLTFTTTLSVFSGPASVGDAVATVVIGDANATPRVTFKTASTTIPEGTTGSVIIQQDGVATSDVIVNVATSNGTATAGNNYNAIDGQYTIPAGKTSVTVPVATLNDNMYSSPNLAFSLGLGVASGPAVTGSSSTMTVNIGEYSPRPSVGWQSNSAQIPEGTTGSINVSLSANSTSDVTVNVSTSNGTARAGANFNAIAAEQYTIPAGSTKVAVPIETLDDYMYSNPNQTFNVTMTLVSGQVSLGTATAMVTVREVNQTPTVSFASTSTTIPEGTTGTMTLDLSGKATSDVKVVVITSDDTAREGIDFNAVGKYFTIPAGSTSTTVPITTVDDSLYSDPDLQFNATLSSVNGPAALGTPINSAIVIGDSSPRPTVGWQAASANIREGTTGWIPVRLSNNATTNVTIKVTTSDGTASSLIDYDAINGVDYKVLAGTNLVYIPIVTHSNGFDDPADLQFTVDLIYVSGPADLGTSALTVNINEPPSGGQTYLLWNSATIQEGTDSTIAAELSSPATDDVIIHATSADGTARAGTNYVAVDGDFTIPKNASSVEVPVSILNDYAYSDPARQFTIGLSVVSGPATGSSYWTITAGEANQTPEVGFERDDTTIPEGSTGNATLKLSGAATYDIETIVATSDGTAHEGTDYNAVGQRYLFHAGETSQTIPVTTVDDDKFSDPNLTFSMGVTLLHGTATIGNGTSTVTVGEADPRPTVGWQATSAAISETGTTQVYVQLTGPMTSATQVSVTTTDGTARAGTNYNALAAQLFNISAGQTRVAVPFTGINDRKFSSPRLNFNASMSLLSGPANVSTSTIRLDINDANQTPVASFNASSLNLSEGHDGSIGVRLNGVTTTDVTIQVTTSNDTACAGTNYVAFSQPFTIEAGLTEVTVPISTMDDGRYSEPDLAFTVGLSVVSGPATGTNSSTIIINEASPKPTVGWRSGPAVVPEGTTGPVYVDLSGPMTSDVTVIAKTSDGTAKAGVDYNTVGKRFTIPAGSTNVSVPITTLNDNKYSNPNLTLNANMSLYSGPAILGTTDIPVEIGEVNATPVLSLSASSLTIPEGNSGSVKVQIDGVTTTNVVIHVATTNGTALGGTNYAPIDRQYNITAGSTSVTVPVNTLNDNKYSNPDQQFSLGVDYVSGPATPGSVNSTVTIAEANETPVLSWQTESLLVPEGNSDSLVVQLSGPTTTDVTVNVTTGDGTAKAGINYNAISHDYVIHAGQTSVTIPVDTLNDNKYSDPNLTFTADFRLAGGPATGSGTATVTVGEASTRPTIGWDAPTLAIQEADSGTIDVVLSGPATTNVTVNVATADSTAHAGTNYDTISGQYIIPAGSVRTTVNVTTLNDTRYSSPDLQFNLSLSYVSGPASAGAPLTSTVTIGEISPQPTVSWQYGSIRVNEATSGPNYILLSGAMTSDLIFTVSTANDTALAGTNYNRIAAQQYTLTAGQTNKSVSFTTLNDNRYSNPNLTFTASFGIVSGPAIAGTTTTTVEVGETSARPTISWSGTPGAITEGLSNNISIVLSGAATSDVNVSIDTTDGTGRAGFNYDGVTAQQVTIPAGQTTKAVSFTTLNDFRYSNPNRNFNIRVTYVSGPATLVTPATRIVTITEASIRPTLVWQSPSMSIPEGTSATNAVQLSGVNTTSNVTFRVTTANNTALAGTNYNAIAAVLFTIPAGQTSVDIPIATLNDNRYSNPNLTFSLGISNVNTLAQGNPTATVAIGESSDKPTVSWDAGSVDIQEGTTGNINATLSGPATSNVTVRVDTSNGTARAGSNYNAITARQYNITPGMTSVAVPIATLNDNNFSSPNLSFSIGLSYVGGPASAGAPLTSTVNISEASDKPTVSMQSSSVLIPEGLTGQVVVQLTGPTTSDVIVSATTADGTARAGIGYTAITGEPYTITAGTTNVSIPVATLNDSRYSNPNQTFTVSFSLIDGPVTTGSTTTTVSIGESSARPTASWQAASTLIPEGSSGAAIVQLSGPATSNVTVSVTTTDGTAHAGTDYTAITGEPYTITPGQTSVTVPITTLNDSRYSNPNQTFTVSFSLIDGPVTTGSTITTIIVGETGEMPTVSWQAGSADIPEGNSDSLTLQLSGPATTDVIVSVTTTDGTARAGTGYNAITAQQYTIPAGQINKSVDITTLNDNRFSDPNQTFNVSFSLASGPATGSGTATVTIGEASTRPTVDWEAASLVIPESDTGSLDIVMSGPATADVTVDVATADGTAHADTSYNTISQPYTIHAGETSVPVSIITKDDGNYSSPNLSFSIGLSNVVGPVSPGTVQASMVSIGELSPEPTISWQPGPVAIPENTTESIDIRLSGSATDNVVLVVNTSNGTAHAGTNYDSISGQYTIPAGSTSVPVSIMTKDDGNYSSPDLSFAVSFSLVSGPGSVADETKTVTIGELSAMPVVSMQSGSVLITEGTTGQVIIQLDRPTTSNVIVNVTTANDTAKAAVNYDRVSQDYTIPAGSTSVSVPVTARDDHKYSNPNQTFTVGFSLVTGPVTTGSTTTTINVGEVSQRPIIGWQSGGSVVIPEGTTEDVAIQLSGAATSDILVRVTTSDGTARTGTGYTSIDQDLTVPAGSAEITLPITTLDDHKYSDPNLSFNVSLSYVSGPAAGSGTLSVYIGEANETPRISLSRESMLIPEGESDTIDVLLSGVTTTDVTVNVTTVNSTAHAGIDYQAIGGNITIPAGLTNATVLIETVDDSKYSNPNQTFNLSLGMVSGPAQGSSCSQIEIGETTEMPTVTWQSNYTLIQENTTEPLTLTLSGITTTDVTLNVTAWNGTASSGVNFLPVNREITIPSGSTSATVPVTILNDTMYSNPNQTFNLSMAVAGGPAAGNGNTTVEIGEISPEPVLSWKYESVEFKEGATDSVIVELNPAATFDVTFNVTTSDDSARADTNYVPVVTQFTIPAGNTSIAIPVTLLKDNKYYGSGRQFRITISQVFGPVVLSSATSTIVIQETSSAPGTGMDDVDWPYLVENGTTATTCPAPTERIHPAPPAGSSQTWSPEPMSGGNIVTWLQEKLKSQPGYCCFCCIPMVLVLVVLVLYWRRKKEEKEEEKKK